jgi:hypothetical protein
VTELEAALGDLASTLEALSPPHALIGGLTVSEWGGARARPLEALCRRFQPLPKNPVEFVRATRVLPLTTSHSVRADIVFGILPVEKDIVQRATLMKIASTATRSTEGIWNPGSRNLRKAWRDRRSAACWIKLPAGSGGEPGGAGDRFSSPASAWQTTNDDGLPHRAPGYFPSFRAQTISWC